MMGALEFPDVSDAGALEERALVLRLASLHADDRRWLLQRLPDASRMRLELLLAELAGLGLSVDASTVDEAAQRVRQVRGPSLTRGSAVRPAAESALESATPVQMTRLFASEPLAVRRAVMALRAWPWAAAVIATAADVATSAHDAPVLAPMAREAALKAAAQALPDAPPPGLAPVRNEGALRRFIARWRRR
jgi:hypothetical protein